MTPSQETDRVYSIAFRTHFHSQPTQILSQTEITQYNAKRNFTENYYGVGQCHVQFGLFK